MKLRVPGNIGGEITRHKRPRVRVGFFGRGSKPSPHQVVGLGVPETLGMR